VAIGAALRIFQYASDTSLWYDELSIVRNLVHRSAASLATEPLRYDQVAPVGFMLTEKGISRVLGESDLAFRILLLPVGLAALVMFLFLARRLLDGGAVPFAVAMFAIGAPFIRYSAEVKSYGIDIAAVVAMTLVTLRLREADSTRAGCVAAGLAGAGLVWFSQPAILTLAGLGGSLLAAWLFERDAPTARALRVTVPIWAAACVASAAVAFRMVTPATRAYMDTFWRLRQGFPPWPIEKPGDLLWPWDRVTLMFADNRVLAYPWPALYAALVIAGLAVLARRNRAGALILIGPLAVVVLAAVAEILPFHSRLSLSTLPAFVLAVAAAAEWIRRGLARRSTALGAAVMLALFTGPALALVRLPPPLFVEDHKTVLAFLRDHRQPGDAVFVFPYELQAVERYAAEYGLLPGDYEVGGCSSEDRRLLLRDVDRYRGQPRVWLIAGAVPVLQAPRSDVDGYLSTIGTRKDELAVASAKPLYPVSATLFDLSDSNRLAAASAATYPIQVKPAPGDPRPNVVVRCDDRLRPLRKD